MVGSQLGLPYNNIINQYGVPDTPKSLKKINEKRMNFNFKNINSVYGKFVELLKLTFNPDKFALYEPEKIFLYPKDIYQYHQLSFSQEGEDMILARFFEGRNDGFYVDVGAFHPQRFSNTYHFYLKGWTGINIEPMPGSMDLFKKIRPNDINLEFAISNQNKSLTYYQFNEPALNGFDNDLSKKRDGWHHYKIISSEQIPTYTLSEILDIHMPVDREIDFMNVDVEGLDLQVLQSNNWERYRPKIVLVEDLKASLDKTSESLVVQFMQDRDYQLYAKSVYTLFFIRK